MQKKGFTFIEVFMVIAIVGILAGAGVWFLGNVVRDSVFIPNQLNMDKLASDTLDIMIDGDIQARGLRFAKAISGTVTALQVTFINQDNLTIIYRWDNVANKLYRKIGAATEAVMPNYLPNSTAIVMTGIGGTLFTCYDVNDVSMALPATGTNVRRIKINLIAKTDTGLYNDWQGSSEQTTSIAVERFQ